MKDDRSKVAMGAEVLIGGGGAAFLLVEPGWLAGYRPVDSPPPGGRFSLMAESMHAASAARSRLWSSAELSSMASEGAASAKRFTRTMTCWPSRGSNQTAAATWR